MPTELNEGKKKFNEVTENMMDPLNDSHDFINILKVKFAIKFKTISTPFSEPLEGAFFFKLTTYMFFN